MALWGKLSTVANNKPKYLNANGTYYNANQCEGVTVSDAKAANGQLTSGWTQIHVLKTGAVSAVQIAAAGSGYSNTDTIAFTHSASDSGSGAAASLTTDGTGKITAVTLSNGGSGYGIPPTVTITTTGGTGASLIATTDAKKRFEPLVAMSSMTS